jgi:hypothetical protein
LVGGAVYQFEVRRTKDRIPCLNALILTLWHNRMEKGTVLILTEAANIDGTYQKLFRKHQLICSLNNKGDY